MNKVILLLVVVSVALLVACSDNVSPTPIPSPTKPTVIYADTTFSDAICVETGVVREGTNFVVNIRLSTIGSRCYEFVKNVNPNPPNNDYYFSLYVYDETNGKMEWASDFSYLDYNKDRWNNSIGSDKICPGKKYSLSIIFSSYEVPMRIKRGFVGLDISVKDCSDSLAEIINVYGGYHFKLD